MRRTGNRALALEIAKAAHRALTGNINSAGEFTASGGDKPPPLQPPSSAPPPSSDPVPQNPAAIGENLDKNKTGTDNSPGFNLPPSSEDEPYDHRDHDRLTKEGHSSELAYEAAKELYQQRKRGIVPSIPPEREAQPSESGFEREGPPKRGKGVTNPQLKKIDYRPHPPGMTRNEFGDKVLKWKGSPDTILNRRLQINDAEIARMKAVGTTKPMIEAWFDIYKNDFSRNNNNYVALARLRPMQTILKSWKE